MSWKARTVGVVATAVLAAAAADVPIAAGHGPAGSDRLSERELRRLELRVLGPTHAREHRRARAWARQARKRWVRLPRQERRRRLHAVARAAAVGDPAVDGRWLPPFEIPVVGVHAAMLPTGKVMLFSQKVHDYRNRLAAAFLWDPGKRPGEAGEFQAVPPGDNIWCGAQSLMADGQLLVTGGNLSYATSTSGFKGLKSVFTFDPWAAKWTRQPDMARGRWYPTQTLMADGRTLITSGYADTGNYEWNTDIDVFTPPATRGGQGTIRTIARYGALPGAPGLPHWYPHWFVMPSGNVLNMGFTRAQSWLLNPTPGAVSAQNRPDLLMTRKYGSAVLLPGSPSGATRVMQLGGYDSGTTQKAAVASTEIYDEARPTTAPVAGPAMRVARANHNTVLLPDRSMVTLGGGYGEQPGTANAGNVNTALAAGGPEHKAVEIYDPATGQWRLGASQVYKRSYHSTALLLPDGRVLSAGDDRDPARGATYAEKDKAEIYEPPYLHKAGLRPSILAAPASVAYGQRFAISTSSPVASAVLITPGATTHANDMHQRLVSLTITPNADGTGAELTAPPSAGVAPPGYYMLFALSPEGKPSVAAWVRVGAGGTAPPPPPPPPDTTAPAAPTGLVATAGDASVTLRWSASASTDTARYVVYRTAPGTRTAVSPAGQGTSLTFTDTGLTNGTPYSYVVAAVDAAGNQSVDSAAASATPVAGTTPPPSTALVSDTFGRSLTGGWGTADTGGAWAVLAGGTAPFSVAGGHGLIATPSGSVERHAALSAPEAAARDVDAKVEITFPDTPSGGAFAGYLTLRNQAGAPHFRVGLLVEAGILYLRGTTSGGTTIWTNLNTRLGFTPGAAYVLRVQVQGANPTTVRASAWRAGTAEPTAWTVTNATNTSTGPQTAGAVGIRAINSSTFPTTTLRFDNLTVTRLG